MAKVYRTSAWLNGLSVELLAAALRDMDGAARNLHIRADGSVTPRLWSLPQLFPALHHQKLAVIDRRVLYIGGLIWMSGAMTRRHTGALATRLGTMSSS